MEIKTLDNTIIKSQNKMSLVVNNDSIRTFIFLNNDTIELPQYRVSIFKDSIFVESSKKKILRFTTLKNDTIKLIDMTTLNEKLSTFIGLTTYLKDSTINVLGYDRECFVFKQMRGQNINNRYSTHQIVFIDKERLILLKQENIFYDILKNQELPEKNELDVFNIL